MTTDLFAPAAAVQPETFGTAAAIGKDGWEEGSSYRKLPDPETGVLTRYTRASKFAGILADPYILRQWEKAMVAFGIGVRSDLYALSSSQPRPPVEERGTGWWKPWEEIAGKALDAAEAHRGAHLGTAVHRFTEQIDQGTMTIKGVPEQWRPHVRRYQEIHAALGLKIVAVERLILRKELHNGVCGRLDRLRSDSFGRIIVDDFKTGKNAPLGLDEIAIQLAIYANAEWWLDLETGEWSRMPEEIRKDVALVSWVPIDDPDKGEPIPVDIAWGWKAAQVAAWVRDFRNAAKRQNNGLRLPLEAILGGAHEVLAETSEESYLDRIEASSTLGELSAVYLEAFPAGRWTAALESAAQRRKLEIKGKVAKLRPVSD